MNDVIMMNNLRVYPIEFPSGTLLDLTNSELLAFLHFALIVSRSSGEDSATGILSFIRTDGRHRHRAGDELKAIKL